jgi:mycofactocin system creatininase family protein
MAEKWAEPSIGATMRSMESPRALRELTWTEVHPSSCIVVIPVGSLEQHGPHLPLDTDTRIATALAEHVCGLRDDLVLGPAVAIGASGEHAGFPGTLSIGTDALATVLVEIARSADAFRGVVFVNGHGGNRDALLAARAILHHEQRKVVAWSPSIPGGDAHAGHSETSILLAIDPECVRRDAIEEGVTQSISELLETLQRDGVKAVSANGVLGDPTTATAAHGNELFLTLVADLAFTIDKVFA